MKLQKYCQESNLYFITVCGSQYHSEAGVIESPNYPQYIVSSSLCIYEIMLPLQTIITLIINDFNISNYEDRFSQSVVDTYLEVIFYFKIKSN